MKEQNLALLRRQLDEIEKIGKNPRTIQDYSFGIDAWKSATISIIERIFGKSQLIKSKYQENTALQRSAKRFMQNGGKLGVGIGILFKGDI